jgi:hypothetical protein
MLQNFEILTSNIYILTRWVFTDIVLTTTFNQTELATICCFELFMCFFLYKIPIGIKNNDYQITGK